jgi:hypothetical protein
VFEKPVAHDEQQGADTSEVCFFPGKDDNADV